MSVDDVQDSLHVYGGVQTRLPGNISLQTDLNGSDLQSIFEEHAVMHWPFVSQKSVAVLQEDGHSSRVTHVLWPLESSLHTGSREFTFLQSKFDRQPFSGLLDEQVSSSKQN